MFLSGKRMKTIAAVMLGIWMLCGTPLNLCGGGVLYMIGTAAADEVEEYVVKGTTYGGDDDHITYIYEYNSSGDVTATYTYGGGIDSCRCERVRNWRSIDRYRYKR